jgi:hypothetical protein
MFATTLSIDQTPDGRSSSGENLNFVAAGNTRYALLVLRGGWALITICCQTSLDVCQTGLICFETGFMCIYMGLLFFQVSLNISFLSSQHFGLQKLRVERALAGAALTGLFIVATGSGHAEPLIVIFEMAKSILV